MRYYFGLGVMWKTLTIFFCMNQVPCVILSLVQVLLSNDFDDDNCQITLITTIIPKVHDNDI